jgi:hypothetical protein
MSQGRHIVIVCGLTEIDGCAFCMGVDSLKRFYQYHPALQGLIVCLICTHEDCLEIQTQEHQQQIARLTAALQKTNNELEASNLSTDLDQIDLDGDQNQNNGSDDEEPLFSIEDHEDDEEEDEKPVDIELGKALVSAESREQSEDFDRIRLKPLLLTSHVRFLISDF